MKTKSGSDGFYIVSPFSHACHTSSTRKPSAQYLNPTSVALEVMRLKDYIRAHCSHYMEVNVKIICFG